MSIKKIDESLSNQNKIIDEKLAAFFVPTDCAPVEKNVSPYPTPIQLAYKLYHWDGCFWQVPKGFMFPSDYKRKRAWELWLIRQPNYMAENGTTGAILPYCLMSPRLLPKK